ncbi:MAG: transposase family protein [Nitrospirae bacterium]|nr:transposase family protein [Nitrospirota bacterium]
MLAVIEQMKEKTGMPYRAISSAVRLPYPSLIRWRRRRKQDMPLVRQPGPAKVEPPDFGRIEKDIGRLSHGRNRTQGTGALHARHGSVVSRRELQRMVALARHDLNARHRQNLRRIRWNVPNAAWSLDPCEYGQRDEAGGKVHLTQMQDLSSRYKFNPMSGDVPCGEEIAGYLTATFSRFGPPLMLKRDNGGNLNHRAVNDVLAEHFVIPVNSPVHYPPYNGAIEQAQAELKNGLNTKLAYKSCCPEEHLEAYASLVEHDLNHRPRPCLKGKNSCQVFFTGRRSFSKWERRDAYVWITSLRDDIVCSEGVQPQAAWRVAVEAWLTMKGLITIAINGKVSPNSF